MATLSETLKRQKELISSGLGEQEARQRAFSEARGSMQVSSPTPAPTPTPTPPPSVETQTTPQSFNEQTQGMNVEQRREVRQQIQPPAPVETPTPTPTPPLVETPRAETPKVETPKVTTPVKDFNVSAGREQEIQDNIAKITQSNPSLLKDRNAYNQAFGYDTADIGKKALLDSTFTSANAPKSQQDILNGLISGISTPEQNTSAYRNAKFTFDNFNRYNAMTPTQLVASLKQGEIGTDMDRLLSQNQNYAQAKQQFDSYQKTQNINNAMLNIRNGVNGTPVQQTDPLQQLSDRLIQSFGGDQTYAEAFAQHITENPKIVDYTNQLSNVNKQILDQTELLNKAIKEEKAAKGDMPASALVTLLTSKYSEANDYLTTLNNTKNYLQADLKMATEMANAEYQAISKDIDNALSQKNAVISNLIQSQFSLSTKQAEADLAKKIEQEALNDPAKAIANVMDTYQKIGIPFVESIQTKVADANRFIEQGGTLSGYLDNMIKDIQDKKEYKAMTAYQMAQYAPKNKDTKPFKVGDQTYQYNTTTGQYEVVSPISTGTGGDLRYLASQFPGQAWAKNNNPAGITWNANFEKGTGTGALFQQAGINYSKGTARPANEGGNYVTFDTIEDGLKAQQIIMSQTYGNSTVGQMLASWVGTGEGANYAKQVAGMAGVDTNVKVSSLTPEQLSTLQMAKIKKESPGLYNILSQGTGTQISQRAIDWGKNILSGDAKLTDIPASEKGLRSEVSSYLAEASKNTQNTNVATLKQTLSIIDDLKNSKGLSAAVGLKGITNIIPGTAAASFKAKLNQLTATNFMTGIKSMKGLGSLSDAEGSRVSASVSSLENTSQSEKSFKEELDRLRSVILSRIQSTERETGLTFDSNGFPITGKGDLQQETFPSDTNTGAGQTQTYQGYTLKSM